MGTVYEAHDTALDRLVAVKVVNPDLAGDDGISNRFVLEARSAARVNHPHLTHIYFVGTEGGRPFYAMELVAGTNLEDRVKRDGALPLDLAVDVLVQAARGLGAAHAAGVIHRDVKPSNLILSPGGTLKVTDFGLAKSSSSDSGATIVGSLIGTPDYMSPEQCRGQGVDARTDVYALGLTAYFLLTGKKPFEADALGAVLDDQMHRPLPSASALFPTLPPTLDGVLSQLCAKEPARRPSTMAEVTSLLESLRPRRVEPAPLGARASAAGIDLLAFSILAGAIAFAFGLLKTPVPPGDFVEVMAGLLATIALFFLQPWMESRFGGSPGKLLLHLQVVREDGNRASLRATVLRLLIRLPFWVFLAVPDHLLEPYGMTALKLVQLAAILAGIVCYFVRGGRTLSDLWTHTRVTYRIQSAAPR